MCSKSDLRFGHMPASYESNSSLTAAALRALQTVHEQPLPSSGSFSEEKLGVKQLGKLAEKKIDTEVTNVYVQSLW